MKSLRIPIMSLMSFLLFLTYAFADDFDWMKNFNIQAKMDPSGFRASLETRFKIGDADINLVVGSVDEPADAYMLLRLGEISKRSITQVIDGYHVHKGKGWGVLAKNLGIKPGSQAFNDLKQRQDLYDLGGKDQNNAKGKGKSKQRK